jgi:hypothetical protein
MNQDKKLQVEVDACHAALRAFLDAIPECECADSWNDGGCVHCSMVYEIGIAENILDNPLIKDDTKPQDAPMIYGHPESAIVCSIDDMGGKIGTCYYKDCLDEQE